MKLSKEKSYVYGGLLKFIQQKHDHNLPRKVILSIATEMLSKDIDITLTDRLVCNVVMIKDTGSNPAWSRHLSIDHNTTL